MPLIPNDHRLAAPPRSFDIASPGMAHLIGVGGAGMQSLAAVLLGQGWQVSGSDLRPAAASDLEAAGVHVFADHAAGNLPAAASLAVYSDAVPPENVERRAAIAQGIPLRSYSEVLAELGHTRQTLAIAGTHGKSTTTALAAAALIAGGLDPLVIYGATPIAAPVAASVPKPNAAIGAISQPSGGRAGSGPFLVEACEFRANFLRLRPHTAVLLNVEPDHFDCFRSPAELRAAFAAFLGHVAGAKEVRGDGLVLFHRGCRRSRALAREVNCRTQSFGLSARADWAPHRLQSRRGRYRFELRRFGQPVAEICLRIPGRHNVLNAIAAMALAIDSGVEPEIAAAAISEFQGLRRRLERIGSPGGVTLLDDYAHHPTAVQAALVTARRMYRGRKLWCVFQPHQASRTAALLDELAASLHNADRLMVAEIYRAREPQAKPGEVTAVDLAAAVRLANSRPANRKEFAYSETCEVGGEHDFEAIRTRLLRELQPGDVLITMGAGDIDQISQFLVQRLRSHRARS